jgi:hypothetical protein
LRTDLAAKERHLRKQLERVD